MDAFAGTSSVVSDNERDIEYGTNTNIHTYIHVYNIVLINLSAYHPDFRVCPPVQEDLGGLQIVSRSGTVECSEPTLSETTQIKTQLKTGVCTEKIQIKQYIHTINVCMNVYCMLCMYNMYVKILYTVCMLIISLHRPGH